MGDGYYSNSDKTIFICSDNYSKEEVSRLIEVLDVKFNLKASISKRTNIGGVVWRIRFSRLSLEKLVSLVRPYFIP